MKRKTMIEALALRLARVEIKRHIKLAGYKVKDYLPGGIRKACKKLVAEDKTFRRVATESLRGKH